MTAQPLLSRKFLETMEREKQISYRKKSKVLLFPHPTRNEVAANGYKKKSPSSYSSDALKNVDGSSVSRHF